MSSRLQTCIGISSVLTVMVLLGACQRSGPAQAGITAPAFHPRATVAEIMESIVMPSADILWNATGVDLTAEGEIDHTPKNDEEWEHVEWAAVALAEATNSLLVPGRHVDQPGAVAASPEYELNPEQIEKMIAAEPGVWAAFTQELDSTVQQMQQSIRDRDLQKLGELGGTLDDVCEACHVHFWYPEQKK